MINIKLKREIAKYQNFLRWNYRFPHYVEKHYFDNILVYHYDRNNSDNIYSDKLYQDGAKPSLLIIKFDNQLVFVKYQDSVLLDRLPAPPCSTPSNKK
ncbi:MAG: hypothetical protein C6Y22_13995 [Hapalosiphonaceae cyanobacterium JJU2]|nr:MAG: hypothetical protein C6Y22_13995 [Hapalosiphonaceae cyanobacterium JJU2]